MDAKPRPQKLFIGTDRVGNWFVSVCDAATVIPNEGVWMKTNGRVAHGKPIPEFHRVRNVTLPLASNS